MDLELDEIARVQTDLRRRSKRRSRRRLTAWISFGLIGALMGVTWAAGVASSSATIGTTSAAPSVFGSESTAAPVSEYSALVSEHSALTIDLAGSWGAIASDTGVFEVDLTGQAEGTFFLDVVLANNPSGWSALHLEFRQVNKACASATAADWASPAATSVMVVETEDSYATFGSLAAGSSVCVGIQAAAKANDQSGTFIRAANGATQTAPAFAAVLNRSA